MTNVTSINPSSKHLSDSDLAKLAEFRRIALGERKAHTDKGYEYIPTERVVESVAEHLTGLGHTFSVEIRTGAKSTSTKHIAQFTLDSMDLFAGDGGGKGRILIINSYNAECSLSVMAGAIRFCCANGVIAGEKELFERIVHRRGDLVQQQLMQLDSKLDIALEYLQTKYAARVEDMRNKILTYQEMAEAVFNLTVPNQAKLMALEALHPSRQHLRRAEDKPMTAWTLYNVVNECVRTAARHDLSDFEHNATLMDDVLRLAA
jgi:hypothetical protein